MAKLDADADVQYFRSHLKALVDAIADELVRSRRKKLATKMMLAAFAQEDHRIKETAAAREELVALREIYVPKKEQDSALGNDVIEMPDGTLRLKPFDM